MRVSRIIVASTLFLLVAGCASQNPDNGGTPNAGGIGTNGGTVGTTPVTPPPEPAVTPTTYVTVPINSGEPPVLEWLRWQKVHVEIDSDGDARIYDGAATRRALVQYRRMLQLKFDVIAQNIANVDTTRDARGDVNPYRRKIVSIDVKGNVEIKEDTGPFRTRYDPSHPDADVRGVVKFPDVDTTVEMVNAQKVAIEYQQVVGILQRFDPTILVPNPEAARVTFPNVTPSTENPLPLSSR